MLCSVLSARSCPSLVVVAQTQTNRSVPEAVPWPLFTITSSTTLSSQQRLLESAFASSWTDLSWSRCIWTRTNRRQLSTKWVNFYYSILRPRVTCWCSIQLPNERQTGPTAIFLCCHKTLNELKKIRSIVSSKAQHLLNFKGIQITNNLSQFSGGHLHRRLQEAHWTRRHLRVPRTVFVNPLRIRQQYQAEGTQHLFCEEKNMK